MSKLDDPNYRELCRLADEIGADVELHYKKLISKKIIFIIKVFVEGKLLIQKAQFRNETIDEMAAQLLLNREWVPPKKK